jgi:hypothetical protein
MLWMVLAAGITGMPPLPPDTLAAVANNGHAVLTFSSAGCGGGMHTTPMDGADLEKGLAFLKRLRPFCDGFDSRKIVGPYFSGGQR